MNPANTTPQRTPAPPCISYNTDLTSIFEFSEYDRLNQDVDYSGPISNLDHGNDENLDLVLSSNPCSPEDLSLHRGIPLPQ